MSHHLPSDQAADSRRTSVLGLLLEKFPDKIDATDSVVGNTHFSPLHMAAIFGILSAVEFLVEKGAYLDIETKSTDKGHLFGGHTAVGLAIHRENYVPAWISEGGQREVGLFRSSLKKIVALLVKAGSQTPGHGADQGTCGRFQLVLNPELRGILNFSRQDSGKKAELATKVCALG